MRMSVPGLLPAQGVGVAVLTAAERTIPVPDDDDALEGQPTARHEIKYSALNGRVTVHTLLTANFSGSTGSWRLSWTACCNRRSSARPIFKLDAVVVLVATAAGGRGGNDGVGVGPESPTDSSSSSSSSEYSPCRHRQYPANWTDIRLCKYKHQHVSISIPRGLW